jgi:MFS family permease
MIVLNSTIVNVTLPFIRQELQLTEAAASWVTNAYLISFGGSLLLGGWLGDKYGHRRVFLWGNAFFTLASLGCAWGATAAILVGARVLQGLSGAMVAATSLGLITTLFTGAERSRALGVYGFVSYGGGVVGLVVGGLVASAFNWHWTFFFNVPVGIAAHLLCVSLLPAAPRGTREHRSMRWPVRQLRGFPAAIVITLLWSAAIQTWYFTLPLYLQGMMDATPAQVALAFLPSQAVMALVSLVVAPILVVRFGSGVPLIGGLILGAVGLALLARTSATNAALGDVFPAVTVLGLAMGIVLNALLSAAMRDVLPAQSGLASGLLNTTSVAGQSLGLAVAAGLCASFEPQTRYAVAFLSGAGYAVLAAFIVPLLLRPPTNDQR